MAAITGDIGAKLRAARQQNGTSLRSVATSLGVSPSLISQVETGKTQPSVNTLYAWVTLLGISFDDLMANPSSDGQPAPISAKSKASTRGHASVEPGPFQSSRDNPVIDMENGVRWERLAIGQGGDVQPLLVTYAPGGSSSIEGKMTRHNGHEYAYLISGELTAQLEFDTHVLSPGDSLSFDSMKPHLYVNRSDTPAVGIWFVVGREDHANEDARMGHATHSAVNSAVDVLRAMDQISARG
ncbi:putative Transcriptional regulator [metagenome]|uniref:Putative Transcriptional regulator n=1 Tax=metagenome TaxID=256318 RepID=A0A2P2C0G0_9ZZZZ